MNVLIKILTNKIFIVSKLIYFKFIKYSKILSL